MILPSRASLSAAFLQDTRHGKPHHAQLHTTILNLDQPAVAINPNVLLSSLLGSWRVEVFSEAVRAVIVVVVPLVLLVALDRPWLPAPDFVQLDVDARLDMFAHISVRKGATGAESGRRVKGLENEFKHLKGLSIFPPKEDTAKGHEFDKNDSNSFSPCIL